MTLSNTAILSIVELVIYLPIAPFVLYLTYRHGRHGFLGYLYLNLACGVRMVADVIEIIQSTQSGSSMLLVTSVVGSIGLSPLILALAGFLHELHHHFITTTTARAKAGKTERWLWLLQIQIHTAVVVGMVLIVIGGVHLATDKSAVNANRYEKLRSAGAVILLLVWLGLVQYSGWLLYRCSQVRTGLGTSVSQLARWSLVASFIIGVKVIYAVVYTFDYWNTVINPVTGSLAVKVALTVIPTIAAVLAMVFGGWRSVGIAEDHQFREVDVDGDYTSYESTQLIAQKASQYGE